jgi:hypothetical protein
MNPTRIGSSKGFVSLEAQVDSALNLADGAHKEIDQVNQRFDAHLAAHSSGGVQTTIVSPTEPVSPQPGMLWMDTTNNILKVRNSTNTAWLNCANISSSSHNPVTITTFAQNLLSLSDQQLNTVMADANTFFAGPSSGGSQYPAFRTLVDADIPSAIARRADKLSAFAATTSAELAGVISDETGTGVLVFNTSPTFITKITCTGDIELTGNLKLPNTSGTSIGVIYKDTSPFIHNNGYSNTALGINALAINDGGGTNTAIGNSVLSANTYGADNTGVGAFALKSNTEGYSNVAIGSGAMEHNTLGVENTSVGTTALHSNVDGNSNVAIGSGAMLHNTSGYNNVCVGLAMYWHETGGYNAAFAHNALNSNKNGSYNAALGYAAAKGAYGSSISYNTVAGAKAGYNLTTGADGNVLFGYQAGDNITTGSQNVIIGYDIDAPSATGSKQLNIAGLLTATDYTVGLTITKPTTVLTTTEQLRLSYDASNYASFTVSNGGNLTVAPSGGTLAVTGAMNISGAVIVPGIISATEPVSGINPGFLWLQP